MKFMIMLFMLAASEGVQSQSISFEAIASDGGNFSNGSSALSFTTGETMAGPLSNGNPMISQGFQQTYYTFWVGNANTNWANPLNWNGGPVPDLNTDLVILPARPQYPVINVNVSCRSIEIQTGATVTVQNGAVLTVRN